MSVIVVTFVGLDSWVDFERLSIPLSKLNK